MLGRTRCDRDRRKFSIHSIPQTARGSLVCMQALHLQQAHTHVHQQERVSRIFPLHHVLFLLTAGRGESLPAAAF